MTTSNTAPHSGAPIALPALLVYADRLDQQRTYTLRYVVDLSDDLGWQLAERTLDAPIGGGLRAYGGPAIPHVIVAVEVGADLRTAEPGAMTTVTSSTNERTNER